MSDRIRTSAKQAMDSLSSERENNEVAMSYDCSTSLAMCVVKLRLPPREVLGPRRGQSSFGGESPDGSFLVNFLSKEN